MRLLMGPILAKPRLGASANRRSDCLRRVLRGCRAGDRTREPRRRYHRAHQWEPLLRPQTTIKKEPTQRRRDDGFPILQIIRCPPMADAVVAVAIFQQHFPSMVTMECDGKGDPGVVCLLDARPFHCLFIFRLSSRGWTKIGKQKDRLLLFRKNEAVSGQARAVRSRMLPRN